MSTLNKYSANTNIYKYKYFILSVCTANGKVRNIHIKGLYSKYINKIKVVSEVRFSFSSGLNIFRWFNIFYRLRGKDLFIFIARISSLEKKALK